jgi:hypothetical protein
MNQKTSVPQAVACGAGVTSRVVLKSQSFFASFCSQKEALPTYCAGRLALRGYAFFGPELLGAGAYLI